MVATSFDTQIYSLWVDLAVSCGTVNGLHNSSQQLKMWLGVTFMFYSDLSTMNYQKSHIKKIFDLLFKSGNIHYYAEI